MLSGILGRRCAVALVAAAAVACAGPTHSRTDYELKLANTAESLTSAAQTVVMAADLLRRDRAFQPYTADVISQAEDDATSIQETFDSRQPPDATSDDLRQRADTTLEAVVSAITDARVAVRASDMTGLGEAADEIRGLLDNLEKLQEI